MLDKCPHSKTSQKKQNTTKAQNFHKIPPKANLELFLSCSGCIKIWYYGEATIESQNKLSPKCKKRQLSPKQITLTNLPNADSWVPNVNSDNWKGCIFVVWLGRFAPFAK